MILGAYVVSLSQNALLTQHNNNIAMGWLKLNWNLEFYRIPLNFLLHGEIHFARDWRASPPDTCVV
jgi:hypothetical protein